MTNYEIFVNFEDVINFLEKVAEFEEKGAEKEDKIGAKVYKNTAEGIRKMIKKLKERFKDKEWVSKKELLWQMKIIGRWEAGDDPILNIRLTEALTNLLIDFMIIGKIRVKVKFERKGNKK